MRCQACRTEISTEFTYAIQENLCPKCGSDIMAPEKHQQYLLLVQDLGVCLQVTNDPTLNQNIISSVSSLLIEHYKFKKVKGIPKQARRPRPAKQPVQSHAHEQVAAEEFDDLEDDFAVESPAPGGGVKPIMRADGRDTVDIGRSSEEIEVGRVSKTGQNYG